MGLFDKIKDPVFLRESHSGQKQLEALEALRQEAHGPAAEKIEMQLQRVRAGIAGENAVRFELKNSHIPMIVLEDLVLEKNDLSAQIDFLVLTRHCQFVLECKNLFGSVEIKSSGDFVRTIELGQKKIKEGIYSPVTQNRRHLELIREIRGETKTNPITRAVFEKGFGDSYHSLVVLANPKTVLYDRYAKREVRSQVIRVDQLSEKIRTINGLAASPSIGEKDMEELAEFFLAQHRERTVDYLGTLREQLKQEASACEPEKTLVCPRCGAPMVKRRATRGPNAGKEFYGCSAFPRCKCIINIQ